MHASDRPDGRVHDHRAAADDFRVMACRARLLTPTTRWVARLKLAVPGAGCWSCPAVGAGHPALADAAASRSLAVEVAAAAWVADGPDAAT
ncbi:MAG: hypothetical protein M3R65_08105, partial [Gemmatimonadota bacterium]|nr:hypothetical protein [Gemmatimonadota bacterium]